MPMRFILCLCFVLSGAASVAYQMVWLRQAMTYFGVITPVISSVLSTFMFGLAIGTIASGKWTRRIGPKPSLALYALTELAIGVLALTIPACFRLGYRSLLQTGAHDSGGYLFWSWLIICAILLPICTLIGATLPFIMRFLESGKRDGKNFGYLYFANLVGALIGCVSSPFLIELFGFLGTLHIIIAFNIAAALLAAALYVFQSSPTPEMPEMRVRRNTGKVRIPARYAGMLFLTGMVALGSEVIWIRSFTPALSTTVYAFAAVLAVYLISNFLGTWNYLEDKGRSGKMKKLLMAMPAAAMLPAIGSSMLLLESLSVISIAVVCFIFGYITPCIIDSVCENDPEKTARAYCWNFAGCIVGPLTATYLLFPVFGLKGSLMVYALILLASVSWFLEKRSRAFGWSAGLLLGTLAVSISLPNMEDFIEKHGVLTRDHVGYIGGVGRGMNRRLLVNGIGMTNLTTITKNMAYIPLAYRPEATSALDICFGMGTTLRALTHWPLQRITVAELSPGVVRTFGYFHEDAAKVLADPRVHIVVDDGRRYLSRTTEHYDIITIDPPPPVSASGSGLLYTSEFIAAAKNRLTPGGILAHWLPNGDPLLHHAVVNAIMQHFKNVIVFDSIEGWGIHILASDGPLPEMSAQEFAQRLPQAAKLDLKEYAHGAPMNSIAAASMRRMPLSKFILPHEDNVFMSDDRLYNEFYLLRAMGLYHP